MIAIASAMDEVVVDADDDDDDDEEVKDLRKEEGGGGRREERRRWGWLVMRVAARFPNGMACVTENRLKLVLYE